MKKKIRISIIPIILIIIAIIIIIVLINKNQKKGNEQLLQEEYNKLNYSLSKILIRAGSKK